MRKISMQAISKIEKELKNFELFNSKLEKAVKLFVEAMAKANKKLIATNSPSAAYSKVFYLLKNNTPIFTKKDFSCFYDEHLINAIIKEIVGTEKLSDMHKAAVGIREVVLEAYASRNKLREMAEDYADTEELVDAIELLILNRGIALKEAYNELNNLKRTATMVA